MSLLCAFLIVLFFAFGAKAQPFAIEPDATYDAIGASAQVMRHDRGAVDLAAARVLKMSDQFQPSATAHPGAGMTTDAFWAWIDLKNVANRSGEWRLHIGQPFLARMEVHLVRNDVVETLLLESHKQAYGDRMTPARLLASQTFAMAPGETATLWIGWQADGVSRLPLVLEPPLAMFERDAADAWMLGPFYAIGIVMLGVMIVMAISFREPVSTYYTAFFALLLAYNAQLDGLLFVTIWRSAPEWNALASHPIGLLALVAGLMMARSYLNAASRYRVMNIALLGLSAIAIAYIPSPLFAPLVVVKSYAGPIVLGFLLLQIVAGVLALMGKHPGSKFFAAGVLSLLGYLGFFTATSQIPDLTDEDLRSQVLRIGQLVQAAVFAGAVLARVRAMPQAEKAARAALEEQNRRIAAVEHDLRQPLSALSTAVDRLSNLRDAPQEVTLLRNRLNEAATYLQSLVDQGLIAADDEDVVDERYPISVITDAVTQMSADEAASRGVSLRSVPSSIMLDADPIKIMRILTNLTSNAIRHGGDKVVIGARRTPGGIALVVADNGPGMTPEEFGQFLHRGAKGDASAGSGLGLDVVADLTKELGGRLQLWPCSGGVCEIRVLLDCPEYA